MGSAAHSLTARCGACLPLVQGRKRQILPAGCSTGNAVACAGTASRDCRRSRARCRAHSRSASSALELAVQFRARQSVSETPQSELSKLRVPGIAVAAGSTILLSFVSQWYILTELGAGRASDSYFAALAVPVVILYVLADPLSRVTLPLMSVKDEHEQSI